MLFIFKKKKIYENQTTAKLVDDSEFVTRQSKKRFSLLEERKLRENRRIQGTVASFKDGGAS